MKKLKLLKIKDKYIPTSIKRRYIDQIKEIKINKKLVYWYCMSIV